MQSKSGYTAKTVIGCEIHTQLNTKTKAFCACENAYAGMPDTRVCPVCLGLPGAMPRVSREYVEKGAVAGLALNCAIAPFTKFDRKHYFYPDLAKGYQITQFDLPLCTEGFVDLPMAHHQKSEQPGGEDYSEKNFSGDPCIIESEGHSYRRIRIERIHLEEDVGKSLHLEGEHSYIDYNRSGTPLIEIVTKPDMTSGAEAALFMQTVQEVLRYVGVTKGNLEEGNMRCDANINLTITDDKGEVFHTPISEIKNLNSFKSIRDACAYEEKRQFEEFLSQSMEEKRAFVAGYKVTMGFDDEAGETRVQRTKNSFVDYRFTTEPDIKPFTVSINFISAAKKSVGELPEAKRLRFQNSMGLTPYDSEVLTTNKALSLWFEEAAKGARSPKKVANLIITELLAVLNEKGEEMTDLKIPPAYIRTLADALDAGVITSKQGKAVFSKMLSTGEDPKKIIDSEGMTVTSDIDALQKLVSDVIARNQKAVADYKAGKTNVLGWLMGQVMKESHGKAKADTATELVRKALEG